MTETFIEEDLQAEYLRGQESGLRQAERMLRTQASSLWNNKQDVKAVFVRGLADKVDTLADETEKEYRKALEAAKAEEE